MGRKWANGAGSKKDPHNRNELSDDVIAEPAQYLLLEFGGIIGQSQSGGEQKQSGDQDIDFVTHWVVFLLGLVVPTVFYINQHT